MDSIFLKIELSSNSFLLTVLHIFMLSSHCPLWVPRPFPRFCYIYFSLFHFSPQHALFSFLHFLKAQFPCFHFLSPYSQHTHTPTHRIQTSLWEPKDYNKLVVITGLHGRNKSFPLCFALNPPKETTPKHVDLKQQALVQPTGLRVSWKVLPACPGSLMCLLVSWLTVGLSWVASAGMTRAAWG